MPAARLPTRHARSLAPPAMVLCAASVLCAAAFARPADCGAAPVIGRDGTVLYWTGGSGCAADALVSRENDAPVLQGPGSVTRRGTGPATDSVISPAPTPETRPVKEPVSVPG